MAVTLNSTGVSISAILMLAVLLAGAAAQYASEIKRALVQGRQYRNALVHVHAKLKTISQCNSPAFCLDCKRQAKLATELVRDALQAPPPISARRPRYVKPATPAQQKELNHGIGWLVLAMLIVAVYVFVKTQG